MLTTPAYKTRPGLVLRDASWRGVCRTRWRLGSASMRSGTPSQIMAVRKSSTPIFASSGFMVLPTMGRGLVHVWKTAANNARPLHRAGWFPSHISCTKTKSWVGNGVGTMKTAILFGATMLVVATSAVKAYDLTTPYTGSATRVGTPEWTWNGFYVAPFSGVGWSKNVW